ncbi:kinase-like protein, partial [Ophiobolus disseminans]
FVDAQNLVITKSMDLEKGENGQHCYFRQDEPLPLEMKGILGSGGFGQVDRYIGLIMSPVADMDLSAYLAGANTARNRELRTFFGCLAQALAFLHEQSICHKDIKPSNILVHGGNVLFTDFWLAFDFTNKDSSTTVSMVNGMTPRYCAPEVANYEPQNTSSDIWSLGVVFLEMTAVLKGRTVKHMYDFLKEHGS